MVGLMDNKTEVAERLKKFIRLNHPGQCRVISELDLCTCPLCDIERLQESNFDPRLDYLLVGIILGAVSVSLIFLSLN